MNSTLNQELLAKISRHLLRIVSKRGAQPENLMRGPLFENTYGAMRYALHGLAT